MTKKETREIFAKELNMLVESMDGLLTNNQLGAYLEMEERLTQTAHLADLLGLEDLSYNARFNRLKLRTGYRNKKLAQ